MKRLAVALILIFSSSLSFSAAPINCESAPQEAVTKLPPEVSDFALVFCSPSGHALVAVDGFVWLTENRRPHFLHAGSPRGPIPDQSQHSVYFTNSTAIALKGESLEKAKAMFKTEFGFSPSDDLSVVQMDLLSNKGFRYNVFFFVVVGRLDRIIGCIDECRSSVGMKQVRLSSLR